jgi:hypothetical protein
MVRTKLYLILSQQDTGWVIKGLFRSLPPHAFLEQQFGTYIIQEIDSDLNV